MAQFNQRANPLTRKHLPAGIVPGSKHERLYWIEQGILGKARYLGIPQNLRMILDSLGIDELTEENAGEITKMLGQAGVRKSEKQ